MNQDNLINAVIEKNRQVSQRYGSLDKRTNPRVPHKLKWIIDGKAPNSFIKVADFKYTSPLPLDKIARTFCALEEFEEWIKKVEIGNKKHQAEMEKQADSKICRLKTFIVFSYNFEKSKDNDDKVPF